VEHCGSLRLSWKQLRSQVGQSSELLTNIKNQARARLR
jgi:hypothetical protein